MLEALCFPFDKVSRGSLLGDVLSVSTSTRFKLIIGNGQGVAQKKIKKLKPNWGFKGAITNLGN
jgi:hypothetical protein